MHGSPGDAHACCSGSALAAAESCPLARQRRSVQPGRLWTGGRRTLCQCGLDAPADTAAVMSPAAGHIRCAAHTRERRIAAEPMRHCSVRGQSLRLCISEARGRRFGGDSNNNAANTCRSAQPQPHLGPALQGSCAPTGAFHGRGPFDSARIRLRGRVVATPARRKPSSLSFNHSCLQDVSPFFAHMISRAL